MSLRSSAAVVALALLAVPAAAAAAEPRHREHPDLAARLASVKTVALAAPEVRAWEITANGTAVERPDRIELVRANVAAGLEAALRGKRLAVKRFEPASAEAKEELRDVQLLYGAVTQAILQATFANEFPAKIARFDYALGDLGALLGTEQADAIVFASGSATNSSGGRIATELLLGSTYHAADRLFIALVDRGGAVLWFGEHQSASSDLRDEGSARAFLETATRSLAPAAGVPR